MSLASREAKAKKIVKMLEGRFALVSTSWKDTPDDEPISRPVLEVRAYKAKGEVFIATSSPSRAVQGIVPNIRALLLKSATLDTDDNIWRVNSGNQQHDIEEAAPGVDKATKVFKRYKKKDLREAAKVGLDRYIEDRDGEEITP